MGNKLLFKILRKKISVHLNFIKSNVAPLKNYLTIGTIPCFGLWAQTTLPPPAIFIFFENKTGVVFVFF